MMRKDKVLMLGIATLGLTAGVALGLSENRVVETDAAAIYLNVTDTRNGIDSDLIYWGGTGFYFDENLEGSLNPFRWFELEEVSSFVFTMDFGVANLVTDTTNGKVFERYMDFSYSQYGEDKIYVYSTISQGTPVDPLLIYSEYSGWFPSSVYPIDGKLAFWILTDYQDSVQASLWYRIRNELLEECSNIKISADLAVKGQYRYNFLGRDQLAGLGVSWQYRYISYSGDSSIDDTFPVDHLYLGEYMYLPLTIDFDYIRGTFAPSVTGFGYAIVHFDSSSTYASGKDFIDNSGLDFDSLPWLLWCVYHPTSTIDFYFKSADLPITCVYTGGRSQVVEWEEDSPLAYWGDDSWLPAHPGYFAYLGFNAYNLSYSYVDGFSDYIVAYSKSLLSKTFAYGYEEGYNYALNNYYAVNAEYQNLIYTNGYNYGHDVGYNEGLAAGQEGEGFFLGAIVKSVVDVPINVLNGLAPLAVFDTPIIGIVMSIMMTLVAVVIVKKVIK